MLPVLSRSPASRVAYAGSTLAPRELLARAGRAALLLPTGSRVALEGGDALTRLIHFLGADLAGCATLFVEPEWSAADRAAVLDDARPDVLLDLDADQPAPRPDRTPDPVGDELTPFYLATTSGSSGHPKVLLRSRRSWTRSFAAFDLPLSERDRVLVPGPLTSSLFLFGALQALHEGADVELLDSWSAAGAAEASRRATVIHLVPAMLSALLSTLERDSRLRAECSLRTIVCGGAKLDPELRERLARTLPDSEVFEYYGSTEHSLIAVRRNGSLRPAVEVEVRDPVDGVGELWVRSGMVAEGRMHKGTLLPLTDGSGGTFRSSAEGWSTVGDLAVQHADGSLEVLGRGAATISTGARIVAAEEVESALRGAGGVLEVLVCATPHPRLGELVTAIIEIDPLAPPSLRELRARARARLASEKRPRRWLAVRQMPRTASGKPARALIVERLSAGTLKVEAF